MKSAIIGFALAIAMFSLLVTVIILRKLIPVLKSHKLGQKIYDIGPRWHKGKEGTPVMGGLAFIAPAVLSVLIFAVLSAGVGKFRSESMGLCVLVLGLGNGIIGFVDDYTKLIRKRNQGLKAWQKLGLQVLFASACVGAAAASGMLNTRLYLPFIEKRIDLGFFYYVFLVLFICGVANAVNLTDGIDGLAASVCALVTLFFTVCAVHVINIGIVSASAAVFGGCIGFLVYNFYPAKIFMGDTGSLFLGGTVAGLCLAFNNPLIVLFVGIVFVIEELSVILQVGFFKLTHGKRLFRMAPIHHHFEKCGWSEITIVIVFSAVTLLGCVCAWFGML